MSTLVFQEGWAQFPPMQERIPKEIDPINSVSSVDSLLIFIMKLFTIPWVNQRNGI